MDPTDLPRRPFPAEPAPAAGADDAGFFELLLDHLCVAGFDGYWKRLNPMWTQTLGWSTEELTSQPLIEFVHPDDQEETLAARGRLKTGEPLASLTNRYRCKDGTYRWFEWKSVADMDRQLVYAVARDVTEEKRVRRALDEQSERLAATLNSIADGLIAADAEAAVTRMNPVAEALTGWSAAEAMGRPLGEVFDIVRADTHAAAVLPIERTLEEGLASEGTEHTLLVARGGKERPIAFSRAPMRDAEGTVSGAVIVFRDMTAEKQARKEQEQLQRQLMLADRMASVGTLAAGAAHEINNPLAIVMANLQLILEELRHVDAGPLAAQVADWTQMAIDAQQGADRIRKIVAGLRTFSRREEAEERGPVDLRAVLERSVDVASNEIRHRATLVKEYGATPLVDADASGLGQVFVNLLVNAAQAVSEEDADANEVRIVTWTDTSGHAVVEVQDTGSGIDADPVNRIFDPFFTTKPIGVGTGLSLAVCHNVVSGLGGRIAASNRPEGGAVFRITLPPAAEGQVEPPPADAPSSKEEGPGRERAGLPAVLVVDDEPFITVTLRRILREHDVTAVTSAREALALVDDGATFDVILSDLMMPDMSGMELYEELHRRRPAWAERMVFLTGGAFTGAAREFLERIPNPRIYKPFKAAAIRELVASFRK